MLVFFLAMLAARRGIQLSGASPSLSTPSPDGRWSNLSQAFFGLVAVDTGGVVGELLPGAYSFQSTSPLVVASGGPPLVAMGVGAYRGLHWPAGPSDAPTYTALLLSDFIDGPAFVVPAGASLELRNLTLLLPPAPVNGSAAASGWSLLTRVFQLGEGARLTLRDVTVYTSSCSDLYDFTRALCNPATWSFSTGLQILDAVLMYGNAQMPVGSYVAPGAAAPSNDTAASIPSAQLLNSTFSCSGGAPVTCSATSVGDVFSLRGVAALLMRGSKDTVLLSVAANISLDPADWRQLQVRPGVLLALYGNPAVKTTLDFGGIEGAVAVQATDRFLLYDMDLLGLPYPTRITQLFHFAAAFVHGVRVNGSRATGSLPALSVERCTLLLPDREILPPAPPVCVQWWRNAVTNTTDGYPETWFVRLEPNGTVGSASLRMQRLANVAAGPTVAILNSVLVPYSSYGTAVSPLAAAVAASWPLAAELEPEAAAQLRLGRMALLSDVRPSQVLQSCMLPGSGFAGTDTFIVPSEGLDPALAGLPAEALTAAAPGSPRGALAAEEAGLGDRFYALPEGANCVLEGLPYAQARRRTFYDLQGVSASMVVPPGSSVSLRDLVLINLAPAGPGYDAAPTPAANGRRSHRRLQDAAGGNNSNTVIPPPGPSSGAAPSAPSPPQLPMPALRPAPAPLLPSPGTGDGTEASLFLHNVTLVVQADEVALLLRMLDRAGALPPPGAQTGPARRLLMDQAGVQAQRRRGLLQGAENRSSLPANVLQSCPFAQLISFAYESEVLSYTTDTIVYASTRHLGWYGTNVTVTSIMPPDAPSRVMASAVRISASLEAACPPPAPPPRRNRPPPPGLQADGGGGTGSSGKKSQLAWIVPVAVFVPLVLLLACGALFVVRARRLREAEELQHKQREAGQPGLVGLGYRNYEKPAALHHSAARSQSTAAAAHAPLAPHSAQAAYAARRASAAPYYSHTPRARGGGRASSDASPDYASAVTSPNHALPPSGMASGASLLLQAHVVPTTRTEFKRNGSWTAALMSITSRNNRRGSQLDFGSVKGSFFGGGGRDRQGVGRKAPYRFASTLDNQLGEAGELDRTSPPRQIRPSPGKRLSMLFTHAFSNTLDHHADHQQQHQQHHHNELHQHHHPQPPPSDTGPMADGRGSGGTTAAAAAAAPAGPGPGDSRRTPRSRSGGDAMHSAAASAALAGAVRQSRSGGRNAYTATAASVMAGAFASTARSQVSDMASQTPNRSEGGTSMAPPSPSVAGSQPGQWPGQGGVASSPFDALAAAAVGAAAARSPARPEIGQEEEAAATAAAAAAAAAVAAARRGSYKVEGRLLGLAARESTVIDSAEVEQLGARQGPPTTPRGGFVGTAFAADGAREAAEAVEAAAGDAAEAIEVAAAAEAADAAAEAAEAVQAEERVEEAEARAPQGQLGAPQEAIVGLVASAAGTAVSAVAAASLAEPTTASASLTEAAGAAAAVITMGAAGAEDAEPPGPAPPGSLPDPASPVTTASACLAEAAEAAAAVSTLGAAGAEDAELPDTVHPGSLPHPASPGRYCRDSATGYSEVESVVLGSGPHMPPAAAHAGPEAAAAPAAAAGVHAPLRQHRLEMAQDEPPPAVPAGHAAPAVAAPAVAAPVVAAPAVASPTADLATGGSRRSFRSGIPTLASSQATPPTNALSGRAAAPTACPAPAKRAAPAGATGNRPNAAGPRGDPAGAQQRSSDGGSPIGGLSRHAGSPAVPPR
ncbi:hypothetical protein TSOC_003949 [Tetrabaena socialis]|uniref:Uncharacterized protein n=1 Tax=Tetrabaena socialis TaxID=47790 RepID=A0A2J8AA77_9CHLO|nr:hypothetical protein TSOC_003949 [Tetrabaena socialis]|eukprot:PNH09420.1 hypothetical protein TSOC_003949 [Tetrabaena socialis]